MNVRRDWTELSGGDPPLVAVFGHLGFVWNGKTLWVRLLCSQVHKRRKKK